MKRACEYVLKKCGGLPVALGVAGKTIGRIYMRMRRRGGEERECAKDAIVKCQQRLESRWKHVEDLVKKGHGDNAGLFVALKISLGVADRKGADGRHSGERSLSELHRGLRALQKQQWVPITMLSCLWGVEENEAEHVCEMMEDINVCEIEHRVVNGNMVMRVRVHDLIHDHYVMEATSQAEVERWHMRVLEGHWKRYVEVGGGKKDIRREDGDDEEGWWSEGLT